MWLVFEPRLMGLSRWEMFRAMLPRYNTGVLQVNFQILFLQLSQPPGVNRGQWWTVPTLPPELSSPIFVLSQDWISPTACYLCLASMVLIRRLVPLNCLKGCVILLSPTQIHHRHHAVCQQTVEHGRWMEPAASPRRSLPEIHTNVKSLEEHHR